MGVTVFIIGMDRRVISTVIQQVILQLGCSFEPSSWDLQSGRLGFPSKIMPFLL